MAEWVKRLLAWYGANRRVLPWREEPTPYRVWVSEMMLQQTQVASVTPYFLRFMEHFPDVQALAAAPLEDVLKAWEGLGYYRRARHLKQAAERIAADGWPSSAAGWRELPGIGPYSASAISAIAQGEPEAVVDGNVLRVFSRVWDDPRDIGKAATRTDFHARLLPFAADDPSRFNQAIMELGALVCRPSVPACAACPLRPDCLAHARGTLAERPVKQARAKVPLVEVSVALVRRRGRVLVQRRRDDAMLGGLWEFPGGKREAGEDALACLVRELKEETGLTLDPATAVPFLTFDHAYSHFTLRLSAFLCDQARGRARSREAQPLRWASAADLDALPFPAANTRLLAALRESEGR